MAGFCIIAASLYPQSFNGLNGRIKRVIRHIRSSKGVKAKRLLAQHEHVHDALSRIAMKQS